MNDMSGIDLGRCPSQGVALRYLSAGALPLQSPNGAAPRQQIFSTNGASPRQPGASPQEPYSRVNQGPKVRPNRRTVGPGFQPSNVTDFDTQGVALGWLGDGALPRKKGGQR
jgi:hypothetical protein